jgi:hypothetical protein
MRTNRGIGVPIHAFFTLTLGVDLPAPASAVLAPRDKSENLLDISLSEFRSLSMSRRRPDYPYYSLFTIQTDKSRFTEPMNLLKHNDRY